MRKDRIVDRLFDGCVSLPHRVVRNVADGVLVEESDVPLNPFYGVPASSFALETVLASGGQLKPGPSVKGSQLDLNDNLSDVVGKLHSDAERLAISQREEKARKEFFSLITKKGSND